MKQKEEDTKFQKFIFVFNSLSINVSLIEPIIRLERYAKFMKELVTKKQTLECEKIKVSHKCNAIFTKNLAAKKEDLSEFTIPYTIRACKFSKGLCDLGTSIYFIP